MAQQQRRRPLPPLNWLRAFECAARHLSFTAAAEELGVSQAAISQQVRQLEDMLGTPVFKRLARGIALTDAGLAYLPALRDSFDRIGHETETVFGRSVERTVTLRAPPSLAALWLGPRMAAIRMDHPDLTLRVTTMWAPVDFSQEPVDIEIRYGTGAWPGMRCHKLFDETYFPVVSPGFAGREAINSPADLARHPLIHVLGERESWAEYCRAHDIPTFAADGVHCDSMIVALYLAAAGAGIALATSPLVDVAMAEQAITPLFSARLPSRAAHYAILPAAKPPAPAVETVLKALLPAKP